MPPDISVITVCYNSAHQLEKTVQSILSQKDSSIEYLIIDGASTDETPNVLDKYQDKVDIIVSETDSGIYDAMNKGIGLAKGEYLIFINAGDILCENSLYEIKKELKTGLDVYYYSYYTVINIKGANLSFEAKQCLNLSHEIPTCHNAMAISKEAFNRHGLYNTSYALCADYEWLCRNKDKLKTKYCDNKLVYYLLGGVSELDELTVLKEKALISKKHFGWTAFVWHIIRFIRVAPISLLKRLLIKIGVFNHYLSIKHMLKGAKNVPPGDICSK